jgi:hypothetical protein
MLILATALTTTRRNGCKINGGKKVKKGNIRPTLQGQKKKPRSKGTPGPGLPNPHTKAQTTQNADFSDSFNHHKAKAESLN